ncbi:MULTISPECIES: transmembrane 9 family protein [unclassified Tolypothrix]|uniref:transmembrane 9 family protein n=1 Tax=unclassified Tolypothrix TaxID=2649714 RepID=UPI0005EAA8D6|nr:MULTISPECIES: transmembrane 9 family protein [unclassified Tolypothrix]EKF03766.1 hypothetical protein FDUTEX481_02175 [Tolypothrix sp. PCC 7601]MBE9084347.1 hypothetical protein [Tolypothrix sp. LEGE 11397]UYD36215.1 hypothetical protein HG267_10995 [Tolypothrix sp. PCC 7601]BAY94166.1 hypothetical protein NIES3275_62110 [Microchaete diplosiphon NIES-3275]
MISTLVIIVCLWVILSIPLALFVGRLLYEINLNSEKQSKTNEEENLANQQIKAKIK